MTAYARRFTQSLFVFVFVVPLIMGVLFACFRSDFQKRSEISLSNHSVLDLKARLEQFGFEVETRAVKYWSDSWLFGDTPILAITKVTLSGNDFPDDKSVFAVLRQIESKFVLDVSKSDFDCDDFRSLSKVNCRELVALKTMLANEECHIESMPWINSIDVRETEVGGEFIYGLNNLPSLRYVRATHGPSLPYKYPGYELDFSLLLMPSGSP